MSKIRIYIEPLKVKPLVEVSDKDIFHKLAHVLRLTPNDEIYVFNGQGREYLYRVKEITKKAVLIEQEKETRNEKQLSKRVILAFSLLREDKADFIFQKGTELGVSRFVPFICERSVIRKKNPKPERWQRIALESVRQCEQLWIPEITGVLDFKDVVKLPAAIKLYGSWDGLRPEELIKPSCEEVMMVVGPEGHYSDEEMEMLKGNGFECIKLSNNILRAETAAIVSAAMIRSILDASQILHTRL